MILHMSSNTILPAWQTYTIERGRTSEPPSAGTGTCTRRGCPSTGIFRASHISSGDHQIFRLADIVRLYAQRLEQLGVDAPQDWRKNCWQKYLSWKLTSRKATFFYFQKDVGFVLPEASDYYSEATILGKAANILRRHILDHKTTIDEGCIELAVPLTLLQFVALLEHGADIKSQLRFGASKTDLAIAQLLQYNCHVRYKEGSATHRHFKDKETPFPVYMGMSVYTKTRKRTLAEMLNENGISISYDRVLEISAQLGDATVSKYVEDGVVYAPVTEKGCSPHQPWPT